MEWQPIETAPKDGREIIVYGVRRGDWGYTDDESTWTGARWSAGSYGFPGSWLESKARPNYSTGFTPTHWIPLPAPPTENRETK